MFPGVHMGVELTVYGLLDKLLRKILFIVKNISHGLGVLHPFL